MFGSTILDVAIGITFVFLLLSLIASAIREGLESLLRTRASHLEQGLKNLLQDPQGTGLVKQLYAHPLVYGLYTGNYTPDAPPSGVLAACLKKWGFWRWHNLPSYIPAHNFVTALLDMVARGPNLDASVSADTTAPVTVASIRANVGTIENAAVQRTILISLDRAGDDLQALEAHLETWFNSGMDRVSGWYRRQTTFLLLGIGLLLALVFNINALKITNNLYNNTTARTLVVDSTKSAVARGSMPSTGDIAGQLQELNFPIGWPGDRHHMAADFRAAWPSDLAGWIITAFAISMGAPFWFDSLNKLIVVRSTVKPHQKSPEESSQEVSPNPQSTIATAPEPAPAVAVPIPTSGDDAESDGCDVDMTSFITQDEALPASIGGVS